MTIKDDDVEDSGETFELVLENPDRGAVIDPRRKKATGTINDGDEGPLAASFPSSPYMSRRHTGSSDRPQVVVEFNEAVASFTKSTPSVSVDNGAIRSVQAHTEDGLEHAYIFILTPDGDEALRFRLIADQACDAGGICTQTGKRLTDVPTTRTIPGPEESEGRSALSVTDAEGNEEDDATIDFVVTLDPASGTTVTVDYSTEDVTAEAGTDYTAKSGTLTFNPGDTSKTVRVALIDDAVEDDGETFTLRLSNASGADIEDATGTGTIQNMEAADVNSPATGALTISGTAEVGQALVAGTDNIEDADGLSQVRYAYQWLRNGSAIAGATSQGYGLVGADEDTRIRVQVTFQDDAGNDESLTSAATEPVAPEPVPLTASFENVPSEHAGPGTTFTFRLRFSETFKLSYTVLRDYAFQVSGGRVDKAKRVDGRDDLREIEIEPQSSGTITITLPATTSCSASGAICTADGRMLSNSTSASIQGPPGVSIADARVEEAAGAVLAFAVTLSRSTGQDVTVDYATSDGTAEAGADYTATSGTLTMSAGSTSGTIEVPVLDDAHDDDDETLTLTLSNPTNAVITDGTATGTIDNNDVMPRTLMARFGRATAGHIVDQIEERINARRAPGFDGQIAGRRIDRNMGRNFALGFMQQLGGYQGYGSLGGPAAMPGTHTPGATATELGSNIQPMQRHGMPATRGANTAPMTAAPQRPMQPGQEAGMGAGYTRSTMLAGSGFAMNRGTKNGGVLSFWSRSAQSRFHGREGVLALNGDVRTSTVGADYSKGRMTTGVALAHSRGNGEYTGTHRGRMASSITGLYPWIGYEATERITVWTVAGYGTGGLLLKPGRREGHRERPVDGDGGRRRPRAHPRRRARVHPGVQGRRPPGVDHKRRGAHRDRAAERDHRDGDADENRARGRAHDHGRQANEHQDDGGDRPAARRRGRRDGGRPGHRGGSGPDGRGKRAGNRAPDAGGCSCTRPKSSVKTGCRSR